MAKAKPIDDLELTDVEDASAPIDIWSEFPGITESKYFHEYLTRLSADRDMHTVITASSETGVGKTRIAGILCMLGDIRGWHPREKASVADARRYAYLYDRVEPGSWLMLDEAEKAVDARRGGTHENVDLSQDFAAKRYRQVFAVLTAPTRSWVDKRIGADASDYWIQCLETPEGRPKGEARVYRLRTNEHYMTDYTDRTETLSWPSLDGHRFFRELYKMKRESEDRGSKDYWRDDEVQELKTNYWRKATRKTRFNLVKGMSAFGLSDQEISDILNLSNGVEGIGRRRVNDLVNAESFEEVYST